MILAMKRSRSMARGAAVAVAVSAILLSACQTTETERPSGAVVGAVSGAAVGAGAQAGMRIASGGHTGNPLLGLLVGAIVGGIAGHYLIDTPGGGSSIALSEEDRALAEATAAKAAAAPDGERSEWRSATEEDVHGWAEPFRNVQGEDGRRCREVKWSYYRGSAQTVHTSRYCLEGEKWSRI